MFHDVWTGNKRWTPFIRGRYCGDKGGQFHACPDPDAKPGRLHWVCGCAWFQGFGEEEQKKMERVIW